MRLMRRLRDGKIAVYEPTCIATGRWEEVIQKAPEPEPQKPVKPKVTRPLKPLVRKTEPEQVAALFAPPALEAQTQ